MRAARPSLLVLILMALLAALIGPPGAVHVASAAAPIGPSVVLGSGRTNCAPATAPDGDGVLAVAVDSRSESDSVITVRRWSPQGGWGPRTALSTSIRMPLSCTISVASDGRVAAVVWPGYLPDGRMVLQSAVRPGARGPWQAASTLMPSALDAAAGAPAAEPAKAWAVVAGGRVVVAWNTWVESAPELGAIETATWQGGSWRPATVLVPGGEGGVYLVDVLPTSSGVVALAVRQRAGTEDLLSRSWTPGGGWAAEQVVSTYDTYQCMTQAVHGGRRTVLLEKCRVGEAGHLRVREWRAGRWSGRTSVADNVARLDATAFLELAASSSAVAVAYQVAGPGESWSAYVARSLAPGRWAAPVRVVASDVQYARPEMFALRGADAIVQWSRPNLDAKPGEVATPVFVRTLRADGRVLPDVPVGYGVMVTCYQQASGDATAAFVWGAFCQKPFRLAAWTGRGSWLAVNLSPAAVGSAAVDTPWSVTTTTDAVVVAWQAENTLVAVAVTP